VIKTFGITPSDFGYSKESINVVWIAEVYYQWGVGIYD
jgi:hypothetical protein